MYSLLFRSSRSVVELHRLRVSAQNSSSSFFSSTTTSVADIGKCKNLTVSYLIDSLGLATNLAESITTKVSFEDKRNPDSVLSLFRDYGFTVSQISTIITEYPRVLTLDAEKSLAPKLQFLQSRGVSSSELINVVSTVPEILGKKLVKTMSVYYDCAKGILESDRFEKLSYSLPQGSKQESNRGFHGKEERFEGSLNKVLGMGFDPTTPKFLKALCVFNRTSYKAIEERVYFCTMLGFDVGDVWEMFNMSPDFLALTVKKILISHETFVGLGFSRDEFVMILKSSPQCVKYSVEAVKKKTEFLVKEMNWPLKAVVSNPTVFNYNLEKKIVPRCNVIKALISKGLLGSEQLPSLSSVMKTSDEAFLKMYVREHEDKQLVPEFMAIFSRNQPCFTH